MINPNLKHLRIFIEIARRGSFRSAASAINMSEPATSQAMSQLESLMAVKLLDRTTRSVRVTEAGAAFLVDAERLLEGLDRAVSVLREFPTKGCDRVTLACLSSAVYQLLPTALAEMKRRHPDITVIVRDDNMRGILHSLDHGECDMAIVSDDASHKRNISIPLITDLFQVICPASHPLASLPHISGANLAGHELVLLRRGSAIRDTFDQAIERAGITLNVIHETTQIHTLLGLVESGFGVTVLPSMLCPVAGNANIVVRPLRSPRVARTVGLMFVSGKDPSIATSALAEVIRHAVFAGDIALPPGVSKFNQALNKGH